jgi:hypothetical protein
MPLLLRLQIAVEAETAKHLTVALNEISALVHKGEPRGVVERENRRAWFEVQRLSGLGLQAQASPVEPPVEPPVPEITPEVIAVPVPVPPMPESPLQEAVEEVQTEPQSATDESNDPDDEGPQFGDH